MNQSSCITAFQGSDAAGYASTLMVTNFLSSYLVFRLWSVFFAASKRVKSTVETNLLPGKASNTFPSSHDVLFPDVLLEVCNGRPSIFTPWCLLFQENAGVKKAKVTMNSLSEQRIQILYQLLYSSDLIPWYLHFFHLLKERLARHHFERAQKLKKAWNQSSTPCQSRATRGRFAIDVESWKLVCE